MRIVASLVAAALIVGGCTVTPKNFYKDPDLHGTISLCRALFKTTNEQFRQDLAKELLKRQVESAEECQKRIGFESAAAAVVVGTGAAALAAEGNYAGGSYSGSGSYGVAWDQFYNQYYQLIWRCRDRATGQFVPDYRCSHLSRFDAWPGW